MDVGGPTDDGLVGSPFGVAVLPLDAGGATADFGFGGLDGWDGAGFAGLSSDAFFASLASRADTTDASKAAACCGGPWIDYFDQGSLDVHGQKAHL